MSRLFMLFAVLLALAVTDPATAQPNGSPAAYPELTITIRVDGVDAPREVPAGRYLVTVENQLSRGTAMSLIRAPAGHTLAEAHAALSDPDEAAGWLYEATFIGGPHAGAGELAGPHAAMGMVQIFTVGEDSDASS